MTVSLAGKKVLIAGATGAVGRAVTEAVREAGAWVAGLYCRDEARAAALRQRGVVMVRADLSDRARARAAAAEAVEAAGEALDGLIYAAGNTRDRIFLKMEDEAWDEVMRLHLDGLAACARVVLGGMRRRGSGRIIALGSIAGSTGRAGQTNYSAAKAATVGFVKSLAKEVGRFGVSANVVCPGFVESRMTRSAGPKAWERARSDSALGTLSSVETAASFIVWLLSDLCQGVTGQVFHLDSRVV